MIFSGVEFAVVNQGVVLPDKPSKRAVPQLASTTSNIKLVKLYSTKFSLGIWRH